MANKLIKLEIKDYFCGSDTKERISQKAFLFINILSKYNLARGGFSFWHFLSIATKKPRAFSMP